MISTIILNFNRYKETIDCLRSLYKSTFKGFEVVLVDNGSTDGSAQKIKNKFPNLKIIETGINLGFGEGINFALSLQLKSNKNYGYFLILNNDVLLEKETIKKLVTTFLKDKNIGIVGPKIYDPNGKIWANGGIVDKKRFTAGLKDYREREGREKEEFFEVDFVSGTAMMVKKEVFEKIGLFSKDYFLYYEDVDFCFRAKGAGFKVVINPLAKIIHYESTTVGENLALKEYYMARNHFLFLEKFAPNLVKLREFLRLPKTFFEHYKKREKFAILGIKDYFLRRWGKQKIHKFQITNFK